MSGRLTRETAEPALKAASVDAIIVIFLTSGGKGERLERADYYAVQVDSGFYGTGYGWFAPTYANVYTVVEGAGFYDQENFLYAETTYFDIVDDRAKWSMITRSKNLEYNDTAKSVAEKDRCQDEVHRDTIGKIQCRDVYDLPGIPPEVIQMTDKHSEHIKLESGIDRLGLDVSPVAIENLLSFMDLLKEWSGTYNLVAPREREFLLTRHLLDSLSIAPWLQTRFAA